MDNLQTPPLTPQQKLEYLCAKLETVGKEVTAVTGWDVGVCLDLFTQFENADEMKAVVVAAEGIGFEANEWHRESTGGYWNYGDVHGRVNIHDALMPHPYIAADTLVKVGPRDQEVMGRDFTGLPPETTTELRQTIAAEIDDAGAWQ